MTLQLEKELIMFGAYHWIALMHLFKQIKSAVRRKKITKLLIFYVKQFITDNFVVDE